MRGIALEGDPVFRRRWCRGADAATGRRLAILGGRIATSRKRAGIVVVEMSDAGLAPWSGRKGAIHGGGGRFRLNQLGHLGTIATSANTPCSCPAKVLRGTFGDMISRRLSKKRTR